jgi:hypothetical protein
MSIDHIEQAELLADTEAVLERLQSGKPLDPEIALRIAERAKQIREQMSPAHDNFSVDVIREMRGPLEDVSASPIE